MGKFSAPKILKVHTSARQRAQLLAGKGKRQKFLHPSVHDVHRTRVAEKLTLTTNFLSAKTAIGLPPPSINE